MQASAFRVFAMRAALRPDGLFCQWLPLYQLTREELEIIARTLTTSSGALGVVPEVTPDSVIFGFVGIVVAFGSRRTLMARFRPAKASLS